MTVIVADGTTFARGDGGSPEVFTTIAQVESIGSVGQERSLIDVTNLSSTAREYKKAIKDGQEIELMIQYDPGETGHADLRADNDSADARNYRIHQYGAPTEEELAHHYLWRFWRHVSRAGRMTIFDRSWYGRVLVERVEGFATEDERILFELLTSVSSIGPGTWRCPS